MINYCEAPFHMQNHFPSNDALKLHLFLLFSSSFSSVGGRGESLGKFTDQNMIVSYIIRLHCLTLRWDDKEKPRELQLTEIGGVQNRLLCICRRHQSSLPKSVTMQKDTLCVWVYVMTEISDENPLNGFSFQ